jgi:hypothetical protein
MIQKKGQPHDDDEYLSQGREAPREALFQSGEVGRAIITATWNEITSHDEKRRLLSGGCEKSADLQNSVSVATMEKGTDAFSLG